MESLLAQDVNAGGHICEITGGVGSSKTSFALSCAKYSLKTYPKTKIFMNEGFLAPLQCLRIGLENNTFWIEDGCRVIFRDRKRKLQRANVEPEHFKDFKDLYDRAVFGKINNIFFPDRARIMDFIGWLRSMGEWNIVIIDEIGEVCPASNSRLWKKVDWFADVCQSLRRNFIKMYYTTQATSDISWMIRTKISYKVFFSGAYQDKHCRVSQNMIDCLQRNTVIGSEYAIALGGVWGKCRLRDIILPAELSYEAFTKY